MSSSSFPWFWSHASRKNGPTVNKLIELYKEPVPLLSNQLVSQYPYCILMLHYTLLYPVGDMIRVIFVMNRIWINYDNILNCERITIILCSMRVLYCCCAHQGINFWANYRHVLWGSLDNHYINKLTVAMQYVHPINHSTRNKKKRV